MDAHGAPHTRHAGVRTHVFEGGDLAGLQKPQHRIQIVGRTPAQPHQLLGQAAFASFAAQLTRVEPVMPTEGRVEPAHTLETTGKRNLRYGQAGIGQQLLGRVQAARLQVLQRRDAQRAGENPAQVAIGDAKPLRQTSHQRAAVGVAPVIGRVQHAQGLRQQDARGVLLRPDERLRCQLGSAAQTGAKAGVLGLRRELEELAVLAPWRTHRADRTAVDARGGDPREETAIEPCVACFERKVAGVVRGGDGGVGHDFMIGRSCVSAGSFRT